MQGLFTLSVAVWDLLPTGEHTRAHLYTVSMHAWSHRQTVCASPSDLDDVTLLGISLVSRPFPPPVLRYIKDWV